MSFQSGRACLSTAARYSKGWRALSSSANPRVLITGGLGQLGRHLAAALRNDYGKNNVILSDIKKPSTDVINAGPYIYLDVLDEKEIRKAVVDFQVDWLVHFSALLSVIGEKNLPLAFRVNIDSVHSVMRIATEHKLRLFCPSTIGAFGAGIPNPTPDITVQRPRTIYGVSKVHMELLGEYFHEKHGLDFRSLRFPGILSADTPPGGGTTDYAVHMVLNAVRNKPFESNLGPDTRLPMMYLPDCTASTCAMLKAPAEKLQLRTYNVTAMSFTPEEFAAEIRHHVPDFRVTYKPVPHIQAIADSWPKVFDDSGARRDWGWQHKYGLSELVTDMVAVARKFV